ncbi:uncharacterized protein N7515_002390 [Penicillium bovifimosum]|uniref:J domain-containing protein n=1 Tax=Penicillium bovifimosum TaxID=126998 RepID=A0A9W9HDK1_9EURO|nr:uncharacterized protein N7515_002390 [Penicillium bovifimosum]KAJ5143603.1 hypothetical protein N7515_002390 [Penicillium bovifimosum]
MSSLKVTIDAYAILAVARDASLQEINAAYKRLALKLHPDHAGNTESANEKFREVNEAVEVLRDPESRGRLDAQLNVNRKRARAPDESSSSNCNGAGRDDTRRAKRERRSERQSQSQSQSQFERTWTNQRYHRECTCNPLQKPYMHSYGASCPKHPNSAESKAKRAQHERRKEQWEKVRAGCAQEAKTARKDTFKELHKENVRARNENVRNRMTRDIIRLMGGNCGQQFQDLLSRIIRKGIDEIEANHEENACRPEDSKRGKVPRTWDTAYTFDGFTFTHTYAKAKCTASSPRPADGSSHGYSARGAPSPESSSGSAGNYSPGSASASSTSSGSTSSGSTSSSSSPHSHVPRLHFSATNPFENSPEAFRAACANICSVTKDVREAVKNPNVSMNVDPESIRPLVPYFNKKLADPLGRYTMKDYENEIHGIMLEMYSGWLEEIRLSTPGAHPIPAVQVDPTECRHAGVWKKEFCHPMCEACETWMPLFTLTCPGCQFKACLKCKYLKYEVNPCVDMPTGF